jgi:hypothetical protein
VTQPRHSAPSRGDDRPSPDEVDADGVWVPPPFEPSRPGDFVEYRGGGFEVKRSHPVRTVMLCLVLLAAFAGGGWYYFLRDTNHGPQLPTCAQAYAQMPAAERNNTTVTSGGSVPPGVPMPSDAPGLVCTVTDGGGQTGVVALWMHESETDYTALLVAGGWTATTVRGPMTFHANGGTREIVFTESLDGMLMAGYTH